MGGPELNTPRTFILTAFICVLGSVVFTAPSLSHAQDWPTRQPIRVTVPLTPGSAIDLVGRLVFDQVAKQIGQTIVVENRSGASQTIGAGLVAKAEPDGYTIL